MRLRNLISSSPEAGSTRLRDTVYVLVRRFQAHSLDQVAQGLGSFDPKSSPKELETYNVPSSVSRVDAKKLNCSFLVLVSTLLSARNARTTIFL